MLSNKMRDIEGHISPFCLQTFLHDICSIVVPTFDCVNFTFLDRLTPNMTDSKYISILHRDKICLFFCEHQMLHINLQNIFIWNKLKNTGNPKRLFNMEFSCNAHYILIHILRRFFHINQYWFSCHIKWF